MMFYVTPRIKQNNMCNREMGDTLCHLTLMSIMMNV